MKQPSINDKIIYMLKISQYFYIFSKVSTSIVLVFIIILMGYTIFQSYKDIDEKEYNYKSSFEAISKTINQNEKNYIDIKNQLKELSTAIIMIEKKEKKENTIDMSEYKDEIKKLTILNNKLQSQIENILLDLRSTNKKNNLNSLDNSNNQIQNLVNIILLKFKNGEEFDAEIIDLDKIILGDKKNVLEKLNLIKINKFYGFKNLINEYNKSSENFINAKFINNQNLVLSFLLNFVSIKPSNLSTYENKELNLLVSAKKYMENENLDDALMQIKIIDEKEIFFSNWIMQTEIYLEFLGEIKKVN